jgi:hypothetical protein
MIKNSFFLCLIICLFVANNLSANNNIEGNVPYTGILKKYASRDNTQVSGNIVKSEKSENGNVTIYTFYYENGWKKQLLLSPCINCLGSGVCSNCKYSFQQTMPCSMCHGSKRCFYCAGEGKSATITASSNDGSWIDNNGILHINGSSAPRNNRNKQSSYDSDYDSHSSGGAGRSKCMTCLGSGKCSSRSSGADRYYCHGSGKCGYCYGKGFVYNSYTSDDIKCSSCSGTGTCQYCYGSGKCNTCGGSGHR